MKTKKINYYLMATILTLSVSSFLVSYLLLDEILDSSISLGVNPKTNKIFNDYQQDLKKLKSLDPDKNEIYKTRFYQLQDAMIVYQRPEQLITIIKKSYLAYFLIIFISILIVSILTAGLLSRKVSSSYDKLLKKDLAQSKRLQELKYFDNWQQIASTLAHEIKNPLTPIEMMITNLNNSYTNTSADDFEKKLNITQTIVLEEVNRLKAMVSHFNQFSKLPEVVLENINFKDYLDDNIHQFGASWNNLNIQLEVSKNLDSYFVKIDKQLFKQCLLNLLQNAVEANPSQKETDFAFKLQQSPQNEFELIISNTGQSLSEQQRNKLFLVGYSTKDKKINQGLGLSIVKKIILDHKGDIESLPYENGVAFKITLPQQNKD